MKKIDYQDLLESIKKNDTRALARAITLVESEYEGYQELIDKVITCIGGSHRIGITGPPGAGKSSLTDRIAEIYHKCNRSIGIVAVDPTSPFTGGAILGDRVRMTHIASLPGVFIRSMASRGSTGGLAVATKDVIDLLEASNRDLIITETVGVGQTEIDILDAVQTIVVVLVPESGDAIQALKAGILEIANIIVVNKADRPGAELLIRELELILNFSEEKNKNRWKVPVIATSATSGEGIDELINLIDLHRNFIINTGIINDWYVKYIKRKIIDRINHLVHQTLIEHISSNYLDDVTKLILNGKRTIEEVAKEVIAKVNNN